MEHKLIKLGGKHFDWDIEKNIRNINKHGVSFKEAATVFLDEKAIEIDDIEHSNTEDRFLMIGKSKKLRLIVVCHCYRESDTVIRIISARKASDTEAESYEGTL